MARRIDGEAKMSDGFPLTSLFYEPADPSTCPARIVFLHGFSDHINCYTHMFETLASQPYNLLVCAFDQRGWGRSVHKVSEKGSTGPSPQVMRDIHDFINFTYKTYPTQYLPLFLMGHSMGGQEALQYALSDAPRSPLLTSLPQPLRGLLLEAPYIALDPASQPNSMTVFVSRLASKLLPTHQLLQKLDSTYMSHDPAVRTAWVNDPLCHDTGTLEGLAGMLERAAQLVTLSNSKAGSQSPVPGLKKKLPCPLWCGHGDGDRVTSYPASKKLFDLLNTDTVSQNKFHNFAGAYHKLHAEPDGVGDQFIKEVGTWVVEQCQKQNLTVQRGEAAAEGIGSSAAVAEQEGGEKNSSIITAKTAAAKL